MAGLNRRSDRAPQSARHRGRARTNAAFRCQRGRYVGLFSRSGRVAYGVYELWRREMSEAPGTHNPQFLPSGIPAPQDDGAARHLAGMKFPDLALPATDGAPVNLSKLKGCTVVYVYPRTGVPGVDPPDGWDQIAGARGCTSQSCSLRDNLAELKRL